MSRLKWGRLLVALILLAAAPRPGRALSEENVAILHGPYLQNADLLFFNGDTLSPVSNEDEIFHGFLDTAVNRFASSTPFIYVRGNHDVRGSFARQLSEYFPPRDGFTPEQLSALWLPFFNDGGVDLVLSGHFHRPYKVLPTAGKNSFLVLGAPPEAMIRAEVTSGRIDLNVIDIKGNTIDTSPFRLGKNDIPRMVGPAVGIKSRPSPPPP